jgi:ABC-type branched-subunit amino acid transport system permease subunit
MNQSNIRIGSRNLFALPCLSLGPEVSVPGSGGRLETGKGMRVLTGVSLVLVVLQSLCTAILTISGIRMAIGLGALAASSISAPILGFHGDRLRIPMLALAVAGAIINLLVLAWIWWLRSRPSAQWRRREISNKERRSERLQVALAILTLVLVGLESWSHVVIHRPAPPPTIQSSSS